MDKKMIEDVIVAGVAAVMDPYMDEVYNHHIANMCSVIEALHCSNEEAEEIVGRAEAMVAARLQKVYANIDPQEMVKKYGRGPH